MLFCRFVNINIVMIKFNGKLLFLVTQLTLNRLLCVKYVSTNLKTCQTVMFIQCLTRYNYSTILGLTILYTA